MTGVQTCALPISECQECGVQTILNKPENLEGYYKNTSMKKRLNSTHSLLKEILLRRELKRIQQVGNEKTTFLDVGCGVGDFAHLMYKKGLKVKAADADPEKPINIRFVEQIPYHTVDYNSYNIQDLSGSSEGYTAILRHVLEHVKDPSCFIQSLIDYGARWFYIAVPNHHCFEARVFGRHYYFVDPPRHLWFFSSGSLHRLLEKCNLEVISSGFDTIPNVLSSYYRYLKINKFSGKICNLVRPQSVLNSLSAPLNLIFPNNVIWMVARVKKKQLLDQLDD